MRNVLMVLVLLPWSVISPADDAACGPIVADTEAETRAGMAASWDEDTAELVRAVAGSACIKALSGRYGAGSTVTEELLNGPSVDPKEEQNIGIQPMSGPPGKKPYERRRASDDQSI